MHGFHSARSRDPELDMNGLESQRPSIDRRGQPDRRESERRESRLKGKRPVAGVPDPILTEAEIAALLRGAR